MKTISEFVVSLADLAEAEGRLAKSATYRLIAAVVVLLAAVAMAVGAISLFIAAAYVALVPAVGSPIALVIIGGAVLLVSIFTLFVARVFRG